MHGMTEWLCFQEDLRIPDVELIALLNDVDSRVVAIRANVFVLDYGTTCNVSYLCFWKIL